MDEDRGRGGGWGAYGDGCFALRIGNGLQENYGACRHCAQRLVPGAGAGRRPDEAHDGVNGCAPTLVEGRGSCHVCDAGPASQSSGAALMGEQTLPHMPRVPGAARSQLLLGVGGAVLGTMPVKALSGGGGG